jgi:lysophospholipase L1-like esterase
MRFARTAWLLLFVACAAPVTPTAIAPPRQILILGDSVARGAGDESGHGIASHLAGTVVNRGIDGARTVTVLRLLATQRAREAVRNADAIVISIGGNDLFGDSIARLRSTVAPAWAMHRAIARIDSIVHRIRRDNAAARIYLLGLYNPYRAHWLDPQVAIWDARLIAHFAATAGVTIVRIADVLDTPATLSPIDHFHPSARGYTAIAQRVTSSWE